MGRLEKDLSMMRCVWLWALPVLVLVVPLSQEMGLGSGSPLYGPEDKIVQLTNATFQPTICGSEKAWLVEFYSSWCGHCIHFAPTFKELANDVQEWSSVISVAAIDCALEQNMPTCREYEVMGYPSIKFFSPKTLAGEMGEERKQNRAKTVPAIKEDAVEFLKKLQAERPEKAGLGWPSLLPLKVEDLEIKGLWKEGISRAILMIEGNQSYLASEVLLDMSSTVSNLKIPLALARLVKEDASVKLIEKLGLKDETKQALCAVNKDLSSIEILDSSDSRSSWKKSIQDFLWSHSAEFSISKNKVDELGRGAKDGSDTKEVAVVGIKVASKKELIQRRYKVFSADLEKALLYSISHEVAQHNSIAGQSLEALQTYVTVLEKYFPARLEMAVFLRDLHAWVHLHQDAVRGEDLSKWISSYETRQGISAPDSWQACTGSSPQYGGYPCGLWSLWHSLTVQQANMGEGDPKEVLNAMLKYINNFFGCTECARHFDRALDGGKIIEQEVETYNDSVLLLWRAHNQANRRLSGDISEDPVYPKLEFPAKEFCTGCYNGHRGTNLWDEYERLKVVEFLKNMYSKEKLGSQGLVISEGKANNQAFPPEALVEDQKEGLDTSNFNKEVNATSIIFFNGADLSLCFLLWGISALLLFSIYMKFFSHTKFSNSSFFGGVRRKTVNPLLGKV